MTTERAYFAYENRLVERLRQLETSNPAYQRHIGHEAADVIERLLSLNAELMAALEMLIVHWNDFGIYGFDKKMDAARAALAKVKEPIPLHSSIINVPSLAKVKEGK